MSPILILLVGMGLVIGGILYFRLHAFLALIGAALVVALITPGEFVYQNGVRSEGVKIVEVGEGGVVTLKKGKRQKVIKGEVSVLRQVEGEWEVVGTGMLVEMKGKGEKKGYRLDNLTGKTGALKVAADDRVIHHTQMAGVKGDVGKNIGERIAVGFGKTCLGIGIVIALAAVIGKCLMDSGAAMRIVVSLQNLMGEKRTPVAFLASGFTVGIPVFFDTVFYLLMPLGKAMRVRTGTNYLLFIMTIVAGATMAHSLVPPTPGPLFVAGELGVDLGAMMLGGLVIGAGTVTCGYFYALWANRKWEIPLRASAELSEEELRELAERDTAGLPPLWLSLLPILLPVLLIAGNTALTMATTGVGNLSEGMKGLKEVMGVLGNKNLALALSAGVALWMLVKFKKQSAKELSGAVQAALASGGVIILVTAAGGAFGHVLRQTNIAGEIEKVIPATQLYLLPIAFLITTVVRIAQGSATVAMITAVGIVGPIAAGAELGYHPVYLALAIGCGSKPISWMNDSGFWIIGKMSGMTEGETLKTASAMMALMGVAGLVLTMLAAWVFPFA